MWQDRLGLQMLGGESVVAQHRIAFVGHLELNHGLHMVSMSFKSVIDKKMKI